jgi:nicotinamidase-related amidase
MVDLVSELKRFAPPGVIVDKWVYSPWLRPNLPQILRERNIEALVITGGETDVCVLCTVLGAVDRGFHVILAQDALCSSSDQTHDALLTLYQNRYSRQITVLQTDEILGRWQDPGLFAGT